MKCTCGWKGPCAACVAEHQRQIKDYAGPGGLWHQWRQARASGDRETTELVAASIRSLSAQRSRLWTRSADARVLTALLNGHADDHGYQSGLSVWDVPWGNIEDRRLGTPDQEAEKRATTRAQSWKRGASAKDRSAARRPLRDEFGVTSHGLVGLGMVTTWPGDKHAARYPSGYPFEARGSSPQPRAPKTPKLGRREEKRKLYRVFIEDNPDMSLRQVAAALDIQDRRLIKRLKDHALTEARAALGDIAPRSDVAEDRAVTRATASDA